MPVLVCKECQISFVVTFHKKRVYCSMECFDKFRGRAIGINRALNDTGLEAFLPLAEGLVRQQRKEGVA